MRVGPIGAAVGLLLLAGCGGHAPTGTGNGNPSTPPSASAGGPYTGFAGVALALDGSRSSDPQGETLSYQWNFGDGGTGTGAKPSYTYSLPGDFLVSLQVADTDGLVGAAQTTALISIPQPGSTNGAVYDGKQAVAGAHVYLLAANTTGYGQASVSVLSASATGHADAVGAYMLSGADGGFSWPGTPTCTPGSQLYVYAQGGAVNGATNAAIGLMAALGACPNTGSLVAFPYVWVNEVTTVVAAYSISGFAVDATHVSSSGTPAALVGIANAFATPANLISATTGVALLFTPAGNGVVPQGQINTLADILSACVASGSAASTSCTSLFGNAATGGLPADTATAAIHIAHNPGANIAGLYGLMPSSPTFEPWYVSAPRDFTISVAYGGGGLRVPQGIAVDGAGNVWLTDLTVARLSEFTPLGVAISSANGYTGGGLQTPAAIAFDLTGNEWVANLGGTGESEFQFFTPVSSANGFPICAAPNSHAVAVDASDQVWFANSSGYVGVYNSEGLQNAGCVSVLSSATGTDLGNYGAGYLDGAFGIAIDSQGNVWLSNQLGNSLTELSNAGVPVSPFAGYTGGGLNVPDSIAIDGSDNVWAVNAGNSSLSEFSKAGAALSPAGGFVGGGLARPESLAIDGAGNVWAANSLGNSLSEFSNAGAALSPAGFTGANVNEPNGVAIDESGNVWLACAGNNALVEFVGAAVPVVTPQVAALKAGRLGMRP